jgi:hypothetical protein
MSTISSVQNWLSTFDLIDWTKLVMVHMRWDEGRIVKKLILCLVL